MQEKEKEIQKILRESEEREARERRSDDSTSPPTSPYSNFKRTGSKLYAFEIEDEDGSKSIAITSVSSAEATCSPASPMQARVPPVKSTPLGVSNTLGVPDSNIEKGNSTKEGPTIEEVDTDDDGDVKLTKEKYQQGLQPAEPSSRDTLNKRPIGGLKAVVFDLDGTLIDSCPDLAEACDKAMRELGRPGVTTAQVAVYMGNGDHWWSSLHFHYFSPLWTILQAQISLCSGVSPKVLKSTKTWIRL